MQDTNNELSPDELRVINDTGFFKVKREISHKIQESLAVLGENITEVLQRYPDQIPSGIMNIAPKISQGERYLELPWLILDYPRGFTGEDVFAFRSMFWWGKHFSFTIHISGKHFESIERKLRENISMLRNKDFYICVNKDQWQHHFEKTNYRLLDELSEKETAAYIHDAAFIKLGRKLPLNSFSEMIDYGTETYKEFMKMISKT